MTRGTSTFTRVDQGKYPRCSKIEHVRPRLICARVTPMKHGPTGYRNGCRCEVCREANRKYQREWRASHPGYNREYQREWVKRNPDYHREYRAAHSKKRKSRYAEGTTRQQQIRETHENRGILPGRDRKAIKPIEIFERDGWVCHICREPIDPEAKHPDVRAASIDHVVSLASGGTHTRDNMAASHLICNMRKG